MIITGENRTGIRWCVVGAEAKIHIKVRPPPRDNASVSSSARRYLRNGVMVRERALFRASALLDASGNFGRSAARFDGRLWRSLLFSREASCIRRMIEIIVTFQHDIAYRRTPLLKLLRVLSRYTSSPGSIACHGTCCTLIHRSLVMHQERIFYSWQQWYLFCVLSFRDIWFSNFTVAYIN